MPYYGPGAPFAELAGMTKRLIFSSWNATPTAVAGLLSYEVERRIAQGTRLERNDPADRRQVSSRLEYRLEGDRPAAMSTLALFWPHPKLAELGDPLAAARRQPDAMLGLTEVERDVRLAVEQTAASRLRLPRRASGVSAGDAAFRWLGAGPPSGLGAASVVDLLTGGRTSEESDGTDTTSGLRRHVDNALSIVASAVGYPPGADRPPPLLDDLAALAMHGPGNVAWRALGRLLGPSSEVTEAGRWRAAAVVASGLRSLFNWVESTLLLDRLRIGDGLAVEFRKPETGEYEEIERLAHGQKCTAIVVIALAEGNEPLIIDQPEDALHAPWIEEHLVDRLREGRGGRQFIFASRSPGIVVSADAEMIMALISDSKRGEIEAAGSLERHDLNEHTRYHLEGGKLPFKRRADKLSVAL